MAHRGFSGKYPENTALAFEKAVTEGRADGFESDVHLSKDGVPVIEHDERLDRTVNAMGLIGERTWAELQTLDNGIWKGKVFAGQKILRLEELLAIVNTYNVTLNLEIKDSLIWYKDIEEICINAVRKQNMQDRFMFSSFNHLSMAKCKRLAPEIKAGLLYSEPLIDAASYAADNGIDALHPGLNVLRLDPGLVEQAHKKGVQVNVWTVNEKEDIEYCKRLGVDGIITNFPDRAREVIG
jgi:glycerophosphoryl diester phosphodiesterase